LLDILVLVVRSEAVLSGEAAKCVYKMRAEIRVDVLRAEFGGARAIH
jgi:hypothetical protein